MKVNKKFVSNLITYGMVIIAFIVCQLALSGSIDGFKMSRSLKGQLVPICAYVVMALSLNLTVGILGELSLGHAGFMSVGAFAGAVAASAMQNAVPSAGLRLAIAMVIGAIFAGIAGVLIGLVWGYVRKLDFLFTEIYNVLDNIPSTIVLILVSFVLKPGVGTIIFAMSITGWI